MEYSKISKISMECDDIEKFICTINSIKNHLSKTASPAIKITIEYNVGSGAGINMSDKADMEKTLDIMVSNYKQILKEKTIYLKRLTELLEQ